MRLLPAGDRNYFNAAECIGPFAAELTMALGTQAGPGRFSGSVSDSLDGQGSEILAKESKFNNSTGRNPTKRVRGNVASLNLEFWASVSL